MDLKSLTDKAKALIDKRGGAESVEEDAEELKNIASSNESLVEKAKDAVEAINDPGDDGVAAAPVPPPTEAPAPEAPEVSRDRGAGQGRGQGQGHAGHGHGGHGRGGQGRQGRGGGGGRDGDPAV